MIKLEYIVLNKKGEEVERFFDKQDAEVFDSIICAGEDISLIIEPLQKQLRLTEEQIDEISRHLANHAEDVKQALKQIKKSKKTVNEQIIVQDERAVEVIKEKTKSSTKKAARKKINKK